MRQYAIEKLNVFLANKSPNHLQCVLLYILGFYCSEMRKPIYTIFHYNGHHKAVCVLQTFNKIFIKKIQCQW